MHDQVCHTSLSWQRGRLGTENLETARKTHCVFKNEVLKNEPEFEGLGMSMEKPGKQNSPISKMLCVRKIAGMNNSQENQNSKFFKLWFYD